MIHENIKYKIILFTYMLSHHMEWYKEIKYVARQHFTPIRKLLE
jgi:hypothetical protein